MSHSLIRQRRICRRTACCLLLASVLPSVYGADILRDDFNGTTLDNTKWGIGTWGLGRTQLGFTPQVTGGIAKLRLDKYNPNNPGGTFKGTEIWSNAQFSRGTNGLELEARVRVNAVPDGVVTSFFTYAARASGGNTLADEIDFEHVSKTHNAAAAGSKPILLTTWNDYNVNGSNFADPNVHSSTSVTAPGVDLTQFNTYRMRWLGNRVEWYVNGQFLLAKTQAVSTDPMNARLNFWAPANDWAEAYSASLTPVNNAGANVSYFYDVDFVAIRDAFKTVSATSTNRVFTDRFKNASITNSDSVTSFWTQRNSSGSVAETTGDPLKLTATGAGFPHAQIASSVRPELNFFNSPLSITADGIDFRSTSNSYSKQIMRFVLSSSALTADTQSEYTNEDAFSLRFGGDNSVIMGYKINKPNANSEFDDVNILNTAVTGPVRGFTLVVHPTFYKLTVDHELSATDGTRITDTFTGTLNLSMSEWKTIAAATGNSAMFIQSQLNNAGAGENGTAMVDSIAADAYRSTWSATGSGSFSTAGNWSAEGVPNFSGANAVFGSSITSAATINLTTPATLGVMKFSSANAYTLSGATITLDTPANTTSIDVTSGSHQILSPILLNKSLAVTIGSGATLSVANLQGNQALVKSGSGTLQLDAANGGSLNVTQGTLKLTPGATPAVHFASLDLTAGVSLDLTNRSMSIDSASPISQSTIRSQINTGYGGGNWTGSMIRSSTADATTYAVGYAAASDLPSVPSIFGATLPTSLLMRWTYFGDADLNGKVDTLDFNELAGGFGATNGFWSQGDFNYNGIIDSTDFNLLIGNFGKTLPPAASLGATVPEPASLALISVLSGTILGRRRPR